MQVKDAHRSRRNMGALAVACLVLQLAVAPNVAVGNGRANVAYVFAALVSLMVGGRTGVVSGFAAGLVFDLSTTGPVGLMALMLTTVAYLFGSEAHDRLTDDPTGSLVLGSVGALVVSLVYHAVMLALAQTGSVLDALVLRTLPTALLTIVFFLPLAFLLGRRAGGTGLAGRRGRQAGHYTMGGR